MATREEVIAFQRAVLKGGTTLLTQDYSTTFKFLHSLPCQAACDAVAIFRTFPTAEFDILAKALPKRGKPSELLHLLGEEIGPHEHAVLTRYNACLRSITAPAPLSTSDRLLKSELRVLLPQIASGIGDLAGPIVAKIGETSVFLEREHEGIKIKTMLDIRERVPRICYFQHFHDAKGDQLNGFPLSILEMCGISAVTVFDMDAHLTAESLIKSISCGIQRTFSLVLNVTRE